MYDDDSLDSLNPSVTTEPNSNDSYNQELSEQIGVPVSGGDKTLYSKDPDASESEDDESIVPPSESAPPDDGKVTLTKEEAEELRNYIRNSQAQYAQLQRSSMDRERAMNSYLMGLGSNRQQAPQQSAQPAQPQPAPRPAIDVAREKYLTYLTSLYGPVRANQMLTAQDEYNKAYFKNSFDSSMSGYQRYFDRASEREYTERLDDVAEQWVHTFSTNGKMAGLTPHECRRVVFSNIKAYIDAGHKDIDDINNWVAQNSTTMLMAAADEKRKILLENARRQGASRNPNAPNSQSSNSVASTTAARNMVSTGEDARMRVDAGVTGGASAPLSNSQQVNQSTLDSLAKQTGLRFKM